MDVKERRELLSAYAAGPKRVRDFFNSIPREAITFRPALENAWTMAEHVQHLFDAEVLAYVRYRTSIVAPGSHAQGWDQEGWKEKLGYSKHEVSTALEAFSVIRTIIHHHLTLMVEDDWSAYTFVHPERGPVDLDGWLTIYTGHVQTHIDYFERNLQLFKETK